jgi:hypothetical protein
VISSGFCRNAMPVCSLNCRESKPAPDGDHSPDGFCQDGVTEM